LNAKEARSLGDRISRLLVKGETEHALRILSPILMEQVPFRTLDRIGEEVGAGPIEPTRALLLALAETDSLGGWPIIGSALAGQLDRDPDGALHACRRLIVAGGKWFTTDILAERVLGRALALDFEATLTRLTPWRREPDRWVRRAIGVGIHNWAKRSRGASDLQSQADSLLGFLDPLFAERELDAVKGIGWGLKTLGRYYPGRLSRWLHDRQSTDRSACRRLMLRKALTYLTQEQRSYAQGETRSR
jgi:hypothetical protein